MVGDALAAIVGVAAGDELATGLGAGLQAASIRPTSRTAAFPTLHGTVGPWER